MKLNVNLPHHPYDIVIENGTLSQVEITESVWQPQKPVLSQTTGCTSCREG